LPPPATDEQRREIQTLVDEAHRAVLEEEVVPTGREELQKVYVNALVRAGSGVPQAEAVRVALGRWEKQLLDWERKECDRKPWPRKWAGRARLWAKDWAHRRAQIPPPRKPDLVAVLNSFVEPEDLVGYFKKDYEVDRRFDPQAMVQLLARASRIFGQMLESLAEKHGVENKRVAWVTRLGQVFWGLVEVAVPGSFSNLLARHLVKLLYAFEVFLIVGGTLLVNDDMQKLGWKALAVTLAAHLVVWLLGQYMHGRYRLLRALLLAAVFLVSVPVVAAALLGFNELWDEKWAGSAFRSLPGVRWAWGTSLFKWFHGQTEETRALIAFGAATAFALLAGLLFKITSALFGEAEKWRERKNRKQKTADANRGETASAAVPADDVRGAGD
ncbi:MAG TPA: hypothetical protein VGV38_03740, partial [Pyrinomonadaceae bacterium]|nr:hypothetical protein [Pyrinomonadaceae bacterium]